MSDDISGKQWDDMLEQSDRYEQDLREFQAADPDGFLVAWFNQKHPEGRSAWMTTDSGHSVLFHVVRGARRTGNVVSFRGRVEVVEAGLPIKLGDERDFQLRLLPSRHFHVIV